jgi:hypothetical protein
MNIVKNINQFDHNNLFFCEPIKNNIIDEGNFIRILYSTPNMVLNGIYLLVVFNSIICEKYYNKYKCSFLVNTNTDIVENIKKIEEDILNKYTIDNKIPQFKIYEQLKNGNIKIFNDFGKTNDTFILKISGIWENTVNYGLTYKFIHALDVK